MSAEETTIKNRSEIPALPDSSMTKQFFKFVKSNLGGYVTRGSDEP